MHEAVSPHRAEDAAASGPRPTISHRSAPAIPSLSDTELLSRATRGESAAMALLLARHWQPVVRYAAHLLDGDGDAAQDVAQEVFVRIWSGQAHWQPGGSPRGYLLGIARNLVLNQRRVAAARSRLAPCVTAVFTVALKQPTPLEQVEASEALYRFLRALQQLSRTRRRAVVLSRVHGLTHAQIAARLGLSVQTVANRVTEAMGEVRRQVQEPDRWRGVAGAPGAAPNAPAGVPAASGAGPRAPTPDLAPHAGPGAHAGARTAGSEAGHHAATGGRTVAPAPPTVVGGPSLHP